MVENHSIICFNNLNQNSIHIKNIELQSEISWDNLFDWLLDVCGENLCSHEHKITMHLLGTYRPVLKITS